MTIGPVLHPYFSPWKTAKNYVCKVQAPVSLLSVADPFPCTIHLYLYNILTIIPCPISPNEVIMKLAYLRWGNTLYGLYMRFSFILCASPSLHILMCQL